MGWHALDTRSTSSSTPSSHLPLNPFREQIGPELHGDVEGADGALSAGHPRCLIGPELRGDVEGAVESQKRILIAP